MPRQSGAMCSDPRRSVCGDAALLICAHSSLDSGTLYLGPHAHRPDSRLRDEDTVVDHLCIGYGDVDQTWTTSVGHHLANDITDLVGGLDALGCYAHRRCQMAE